MTRVIKQPGRGYSGHEKQKLYLYNADGAFNKEYESKASFLRDCFPNDKSKRPLFREQNGFRSKNNYEKLFNGNFIASWKIGRENIRKFETIANCPFCQKQNKDKVIIVYNMLNEEIAKFKNLDTATRLSGIDRCTIHSQCNRSKNVKIITKTGLRFKYE